MNGASAAPMAPTPAAFAVFFVSQSVLVPIANWVAWAAASISSWKAMPNTAACSSWMSSLPSRLRSRNRTIAIRAASHAMEAPPVNGDIAMASAISAISAISE
jgi:hypothetical protein